MKLFGAVVVALTGLGLVAGCGDKGGPAAKNSGDKVVVGIVFDKGGLGDKSFNDSAWAGVQKAEKDFNIEVIQRSPPEEKDYESNLDSLAQKADLVIGVGINMQDIVSRVAEQSPDVHFASVDGESKRDNVRALKFTEHEGSFLAGYLAGLHSKTGKVGFVGGMEIDLIRKFYVGFAAGAKTARPDIEVLRPKYTGSWDDVGQGKLVARALYTAGADVVYHAAGRCGLGVFDAAREAGADKYAIGVDSDQDEILPGQILSSMIKRVDVAVYETIKDAVEGKFTGGNRIYGLEDGGVGLSEMKFTKDQIGEATLAKIEQVKQKIIAGEIEVPSTEPELERYLASL